MNKDIEAELTRILSEELTREIDKQIIADFFRKNRIRKEKIKKIFRLFYNLLSYNTNINIFIILFITENHGFTGIHASQNIKDNSSFIRETILSVSMSFLYKIAFVVRT